MSGDDASVFLGFVDMERKVTERAAQELVAAMRPSTTSPCVLR